VACPAAGAELRAGVPPEQPMPIIKPIAKVRCNMSETTLTWSKRFHGTPAQSPTGQYGTVRELCASVGPFAHLPTERVLANCGPYACLADFAHETGKVMTP
jgi:hypothetical protein